MTRFTIELELDFEADYSDLAPDEKILQATLDGQVIFKELSLMTDKTMRLVNVRKYFKK